RRRHESRRSPAADESIAHDSRSTPRFSADPPSDVVDGPNQDPPGWAAVYQSPAFARGELPDDEISAFPSRLQRLLDLQNPALPEGHLDALAGLRSVGN